MYKKMFLFSRSLSSYSSSWIYYVVIYWLHLKAQLYIENKNHIPSSLSAAMVYMTSVLTIVCIQAGVSTLH